MRTVSIQEFEQHPADFISEVEVGSRLTLLRGGKAVATISPAGVTLPIDESAREVAMADLFAMMDKGADLQGLLINRDELYSD